MRMKGNIVQNSKITYIDATLKKGGPNSPVFSTDEGWQLPSQNYGCGNAL